MSYAAKTLATEYHEGQKYGDEPYSQHLHTVVELSLVLFPNIDSFITTEAAWLHDIIEDTSATEDTLIYNMICPEAIEAVKLLTKDTKLSYEDNIQKIIDSENKYAMVVKYCDNVANFSAYDSTGTKNKGKYLKSMEKLRKALGDM
jgi:(p)ppGpp synthase/HD superfamily hydrolase